MNETLPRWRQLVSTAMEHGSVTARELVGLPPLDSKLAPRTPEQAQLENELNFRARVQFLFPQLNSAQQSALVRLLWIKESENLGNPGAAAERQSEVVRARALGVFNMVSPLQRDIVSNWFDVK